MRTRDKEILTVMEMVIMMIIILCASREGVIGIGLEEGEVEEEVEVVEEEGDLGIEMVAVEEAEMVVEAGVMVEVAVVDLRAMAIRVETIAVVEVTVIVMGIKTTTTKATTTDITTTIILIDKINKLFSFLLYFV